jgi:hypothetical protein
MSVMRPPPIYIQAPCCLIDASTTVEAREGLRRGRYDGAGGAVAEWLGRGLQSLVQRFESARRLFFSKDRGRRDRGRQKGPGRRNPGPSSFHRVAR